jgi:UMF1 family MFS transporter
MATKASRSEIAAWCLYDFADSAFTTIIVTVSYALYFRGVVAAEAGARASFYWGVSIAASMAVVALLAPVLGAAADSAGRKKTFLAISAGIAITFTALLGLVGPGDIAAGMALFILANVGNEGAHVFYNGFLPEIASDREMGRISGYGWAVGYIGGLAALVLSLPLTRQGFEGDGASLYRWTFPLVALFHLVFALPVLLVLRERTPRRHAPLGALFRDGLSRLMVTLHSVRRQGDLLRFLLAFFAYNDGVMTVISFSAIYAQHVIGFTTQQVIMLFIVTQLTAFIGAFAAGWLVDRIGARPTILLTLVLWCGVVTAAFLAHSVPAFFVVAAAASIGMGSTQTASRSLMGLLVPPGRNAEFFGFYGLTGKISAIFGPLVYGWVAAVAGTERPAVLSIVPFFLFGIGLLLTVDVGRARRAARPAAAAPAAAPVAS